MTSTVSTGATETSTEDDEFAKVSEVVRWFRIMRKNNAGHGNIGPRFRTAQEGWRDANYYFGTLSGGRIQYKRVLGFGGFGIVTLWQLPDPVPGIPGMEIAVKYPIARPGREAQDEEARREIHWMGNYFNGAEHFVQLVNIGNTVPGSGARFNNTRAQHPVVVMEVLSKFSLYELISRINQTRYYNRANPNNPADHKLEFIPNRVLWRIFLCLVRACIGMAYPEPAPPPPLVRREEIRPGVPYRNIIHFDLDPQNILCGDFALTGLDPEHAYGPITKIADYGLMTEWNDDGWSTDRKKRQIKRGKPPWYAPEQRHPADHLAANAIIGWPLNVWAIGLTMFNLLTLRQPDEDSWWPIQRDRDPNMPMTPIQQAGRLWTWAWQLVPDGTRRDHLDLYIESFDYDLRWLIARCMSHDTHNRPPLNELLELVQFGIRQCDERMASLAAARDAEMDVYGAQLQAGVYQPVGLQEDFGFGAAVTPVLPDPTLDLADPTMNLPDPTLGLNDPTAVPIPQGLPDPVTVIGPGAASVPPQTSLAAQMANSGVSMTGLSQISNAEIGGNRIPGLGTGIQPVLPAFLTTSQVPPRIEDDEVIRRFYNNYFFEPPPPEDPYRDLWAVYTSSYTTTSSSSGTL